MRYCSVNYEMISSVNWVPNLNDDIFDGSVVQSDVLASRRILVLRPILDIEKSGKSVSKAVEDAAWELGLSKSHTWRLYNRMKVGDARTSSLGLERRGPKKGNRRLHSGVEGIIEGCLKRYFLVRERPSFLRIVREIRAECSTRGFIPPARESIKARLDAMDEHEVYRKRRGSKAARTVYAARPGRLDVATPLDVVQIDHTPADIILVDHIHRLPLNRPCLTLAIDVATRVVLGAYVSFEPPSVLSVALCLDHCVRSKSVRVPESLEELEWPRAGIPKAIYVDNGREFHSSAFKNACEEWGISVEYRPAGAAHYGGHIERLIGTTMGAVHVLPGTTQSSVLEKGDYDSSKTSSLTLSEFQDWLHLEICRYHNTPHTALGRTPLAAWADLGGDDAGRQVVDTEAFKTSFMPFEWRKLTRTGITLFSIDYWSDTFGAMVGRNKGKIRIKYDPRDLSHVWATDETGRTIMARYKDLSHPHISLWENRQARKQCQIKSKGSVSEAKLFRMIEEQRRIAEAARQQTKTARLAVERSTHLAKQPPKSRDPSREMFAIDTSNPNLPTYPIDEPHDTKRKN